MVHFCSTQKSFVFLDLPGSSNRLWVRVWCLLLNNYLDLIQVFVFHSQQCPTSRQMEDENRGFYFVVITLNMRSSLLNFFKCTLVWTIGTILYSRSLELVYLFFGCACGILGPWQRIEPAPSSSESVKFYPLDHQGIPKGLFFLLNWIFMPMDQ